MRVASSLLGLALAGLGCATGWVQESGRFVDRPKGLSIAAPERGEWERVEVEGSTLTLRRQDGVTLSWLRDCAEVPATAQAASEALLQAVGPRRVVEEGPVGVARGEAWRVVAELDPSRGFGSSGQLQTVTRIHDGCTDDWVLAAPPAIEVGGLLQEWWSSVEAPQVAAEGSSLP